MKKVIYTLIYFLFLCNTYLFAQTPIWGFNLGGPGGGNNYARATAVSANGNVVVTGLFFGTMNLNPMGTPYNITSNGASDIFLACYTSAGTFLWGFNVGGTNSDGGYGITTDINNNIFICGFFEGGANFNPLGTAYILPFAGGLGSAFQGDGFVAKYSFAGILQWARDLGGPTMYDYNEALGCDSVGNVYVGGTYSTNMVVSSTITFSTATEGSSYLIKYNPAGTVVWGHAFGEYGVASISCAVRHLEIRNGYIYCAGYFGGTANFQPWGTAVSLTAAGVYADVNAYIAKYDTACNLIFVKQIGGIGGDDEFEGIVLDTLDNIYVSGFTNSPSVTFDFGASATSTVTSPGGAADYDIMMAKYTSTGEYVWGNVFGSAAGLGRGWAIDIADNNVFLTGQFSGSTQFDPAGSAAGNLVSAGGTDMFITRYDFNDYYLCGFRVGGTSDDIGYSVAHDPAGNLYSSGQFEGTAINFEPYGSFPLSSTSTVGTDGYLVKYNGTCSAPIIITGGCDSISMPADTITLCVGDTVTLHPSLYGSDSIISYTWSPATGLSSTTILHPLLTATTSGWYHLTGDALVDSNVVVNGSFTLGNVGFSSSYTYVFSGPGELVPEDVYAIVTDPYPAHPAAFSFGDHTTGTGNMMAINGASTPISVWCETLPVTANTNYDFSAWVANWSAADVGTGVPVLQFMINGTLIGTPDAITAAPATWVNFFATWNSGTATSASICIYDETTAADGNDFALDDISFQQICVIRDSVYVKVILPDTSYSHTDTDFCALTGSVVLNAPAGYASYTWSTGATISSITATSAGTFWVENTGYCLLHVDTFHVDVIAPTYVNIQTDSSYCKGSSITLTAPTGYTAPMWSTGSTAASISITDTGIYWVHESSACGGIADTFDVTFKPPVIASAWDTVKGCLYMTDFLASPVGTEYSYLWSGPADFTSTMQNPVIQSAGSANEGVYTVTVTDNATGCDGKATTTLVIVPIPPVPLTNVSPTQIITYGSSVQLNADNALYYWWLPDDGTISNRNINDPVVNPTITTVYTVYGMDSLGCVDSAKITVEVLFDSISIPSAFTPNGDGLNDVFRPLGMTYQSLVEFSVYNRWGQRVFTTSNKEQGWDGTFNGVKQDMDVYNYVLIVGLEDGATRMFKGNVTLIR